MKSSMAVIAVVATLVLLSLATMPKAFGQAERGGSPRWRCAYGILYQAILFPALFAQALATLAAPHRDLASWEFARDQAASLQPPEAAFALAFGAYLAFDLVAMKLSKLVAVHHVACLATHIAVHFFLPRGIPYYYAGITLLELGSGACHMFYLYPRVPYFADLWFLLMAISNVAACVCAFSWACLQVSAAVGVYGFVFTLALCYLRQDAALLFRKYSTIFDYGPQGKARRALTVNSCV